MPNQLLPTRTLPGYLEQPEYLRARQQQQSLERPAPRFPAIPQDPLMRPPMQAQDPRHYARQAPPTNLTFPGGQTMSIPADPGAYRGPMQAQDPRYIPPAVRPPAIPLRDPAAEGPRLDGMRASELFRYEGAPTLPARGGMRDRSLEERGLHPAWRFDPNQPPSAEGPLLDDMLAAELFKRAEAQRSAQEYEAQQQRALANQRLMGDMAFETSRLFGADPMAQSRIAAEPRYGQLQRFNNAGPTLTPEQSEMMRAKAAEWLERQEMVRRMEAQGYTR